MKTIISQFSVMLLLLVSSLAMAEDADNDGFDDGDVTVLQKIITDNPATTLTWSGTDYASWTGVRWDNGVPKRVDTLYVSNKNLSSLNVEGLVALNVLYCQSNSLTSLNIKGLSNLTELVIVNNQLSSLDVTGVTHLQFLNADMNHFLLSTLAPLKALGLGADFTYLFQAVAFDQKTVMANREIDFSSQATVNGVSTDFVWYRNDTIITGTDQSGKYTPTTEGVYHCKMTNTELSGLTILTNSLTVKKYQVTFDVRYKDGTFYPIQTATTEGKEIYADSLGTFKTTVLSGKHSLIVYSLDLDDLLTGISYEVGGQDTTISIKLCKLTFDTRYPDGSVAEYNLSGAKNPSGTKIYLRDFYGQESFVKTTALMDGTYKLIFAKADGYHNYVTFPGNYSCTISPTDTVKVISITLPVINPHTVTFLSSKGNVSQYSIYDSSKTSLGGASAAPGTFMNDVKYSVLAGTYSISCWNSHNYNFVNHQYFTVDDADITVELVLHEYSAAVDDATQRVIVYDTAGVEVDTATIVLSTTKSTSGKKRFTISLPVGTYIFKAFDAEGNLLTGSNFRVGEIGDTVIVKVTTQTTTELHQIANQSSVIAIYPNPATNSVQVQGFDDVAQVSIFSLSGDLLIQTSINKNDALDISSLSQGMYVIKLTNAKTVVEQKLIKE